MVEEKTEKNVHEHKEVNEAKTVTLKKSTLWGAGAFVLLVLLVISVFTGGLGITGKAGATDSNANAGTAGTQEAIRVVADVDDDAIFGDKNAPITIIEFSDYQCPYCGRHFLETFPSIKSQYVDTGKVRIVFRDFPLSFHPMAQPSAEAAECVKEKGGDSAYWEMHDKMFENQATLSIGNLKLWAKDLGYDIASCLDSGKYKNEVLKDMADGQRAGIQGTPGFVIMKTGSKDGGVIKGAFPYSAFQQAINAELEGKNWYADPNTGQILTL